MRTDTTIDRNLLRNGMDKTDTPKESGNRQRNEQNLTHTK